MILFVASNPSHLNRDPITPFIGSKSDPIFRRWANHLVPSGDYKVINVSDKVTPGNRALRKSEINMFDFSSKIMDNEPQKIIALGDTAARALDLVGADYFKLPHPSPLNRVLNNKVYLDAVLEECKKWLEQ